MRYYIKGRIGYWTGYNENGVPTFSAERGDARTTFLERAERLAAAFSKLGTPCDVSVS